jgi:NADPH-dependent curcumin reductase CurA
MIEEYNVSQGKPLRFITRIIAARIMLKGFIYTDYLGEMGAFFQDMGGLIAAGKLTSRETIRDGIEAAPQAFLDLFNGGNTGKMLVRL